MPKREKYTLENRDDMILETMLKYGHIPIVAENGTFNIAGDDDKHGNVVECERCGWAWCLGCDPLPDRRKYIPRTCVPR